METRESKYNECQSQNDKIFNLNPLLKLDTFRFLGQPKSPTQRKLKLAVSSAVAGKLQLIWGSHDFFPLLVFMSLEILALEMSGAVRGGVITRNLQDYRILWTLPGQLSLDMTVNWTTGSHFIKINS